VTLLAQAAPVCGPGSKPLTTPPAQLVSAADYFQQGDYEFEQGRCDGAIDDYTQAIALDPQMATAYNNRAYAYMAEQNYAAALPDLDQAIALRPDYVNALMNRGDIYNYYYDIDYDKALADYDRVLALPRQSTSLCGHRLLAEHHGWNLGVVVTIVFQGPDVAGCQ
jgi:tetratricopeptide (TPR) repeat protein